MAITGTPNRRAELTASARQQANPQTAPMQQNMQPMQQTAQPSGGSSGGSFYGGMGGGMGNDNGSFYSNLGGGMNRPSQTRMATPTPIASTPSFQAPQPASPNGPQVPSFLGGPGAGQAQLPSGGAGSPGRLPDLGYNPNEIDPTTGRPIYQTPGINDSPRPPLVGEPHGAQAPREMGGPGVDPQTAYKMAMMAWQAQRAQAQASGQMVNMAEFPSYEQWASQNGYAPPMQQRQQPPPMTMPSESFPVNPQRSAPPQAANPPDMVTPAPTPPQADPRMSRRGPSDKGSDTPGTPRSASAPAAAPEYRSVYDRPDFAYTPTPQYGRQEEVLYGTGPGNDMGYRPEMVQQGRTDMMNRNTDGMANILAQQSMNGGATDMMQRNPQLTPQLMARIQQMRDMARQQQMQANNNAIGARAMRGGIPRFAFGTDNSAQYQQNGMGNSWIPSTNNSYAQGKEIPPALQKLIDMGMPIPPALLNSVTGGQSGPLNMASAFTARGGGSLPSLQGMDRMSQDEREAFGGYLTGPIGMPEASTMDSIGRPTSNLQTAARSRMG